MPCDEATAGTKQDSTMASAPRDIDALAATPAIIAAPSTLSTTTTAATAAVGAKDLR